MVKALPVLRRRIITPQMTPPLLPLNQNRGPNLSLPFKVKADTPMCLGCVWFLVVVCFKPKSCMMGVVLFILCLKGPKSVFGVHLSAEKALVPVPSDTCLLGFTALHKVETEESQGWEFFSVGISGERPPLGLCTGTTVSAAATLLPLHKHQPSSSWKTSDRSSRRGAENHLSLPSTTCSPSRTC